MKKNKDKKLKTINEKFYIGIISKIIDFIKINWQVIIFLVFLSLIIVFAYQLIVIYFREFFQNFTYIGLNKYWVITTIFKVIFLIFALYFFVKVVLPMLREDKIKRLKKNDQLYFVKIIKKFISKITIWIFVLIFVVLIIATIGNGLFPLIFQKILPVTLTYKTHYYILKSGSNDNWIPKIGNITCQSATGKDVYVIGDILNCNFLIDKQNLPYSFDKVTFSSLANSSFHFTDTEALRANPNADNISFSILLSEPKIKAGINYVNIYIDFEDKYNATSTFYSVQYWIIDALTKEQFNDRNNKKFAYLFGLFAFSLVTGLSIVKNLKEIIK